MAQLEAHIPFLGALLKKEQDIDALLARYDAAAAGATPTRWADLGAALQPVGNRVVFLDLFYGLREEGVPVAVQEWQGFLTALETGPARLEPAAVLPSRACLPGEERDLLRRLRPRLRARIQGRGGRARGRRDGEGPRVAARSEEPAGAHPGAARGARAAQLRRADAPVPGDPRRSRPSDTTAAIAGSAPAAGHPMATAACIRRESASAGRPRAAPR